MFPVILFLCLCIGAYSSGCPDASALSPCTCDLEGISCDWATNGDVLQRSLSASSGSFRNFWMVESSVQDIPNGTFRNTAFRNLYLPNNQLQAISSDAFRGLEFTTKLVELQSNQLHEVPLAALRNLPLLQVLVLAKNKIQSIPDSAFRPFLHLYSLRLEGNRISHLGMRAFDLPSLRDLNLANNRLKTVGPLAFAISHLDATLLDLDLSSNEVRSIAPNAFDGRIGSLERVSLKDNSILEFRKDMFQQILQVLQSGLSVRLDLSDNLFLCGKDMEWILDYLLTTRKRILGIDCLVNGQIVDINILDVPDLMTFARNLDIWSRSSFQSWIIC